MFVKMLNVYSLGLWDQHFHYQFNTSNINKYLIWKLFRRKKKPLFVTHSLSWWETASREFPRDPDVQLLSRSIPPHSLRVIGCRCPDLPTNSTRQDDLKLRPVELWEQHITLAHFTIYTSSSVEEGGVWHYGVLWECKHVHTATTVWRETGENEQHLYVCESLWVWNCIRFPDAQAVNKWIQIQNCLWMLSCWPTPVIGRRKFTSRNVFSSHV